VASYRRPFPILQVANVQRSVAFYRDQLGFEPSFSFPEDEPQFVTLELDGATVGLSAGEPTGTGSTAIWLYTDDVDAAFAELRDAGTRVIAEPADQTFGERVASLADPDGYVIHIGTPIAE
jgi:lactoylglutathione lyase